MTLLMVRILLFCLIPIGIFIMVTAIRLLKQTFNGTIIAETPFTQKEVDFTITETGSYSIWQKGIIYRKLPIGTFAIKIINQFNKTIPVHRSFFSPQINGYYEGRMEIYHFIANSGKYTMKLETITPSTFVRAISALAPATVKPINPAEYFIQVRKSRPVYYMFIAIPLLILAFFFIVGGFIMGLLADQVFNNSGFIQ